MVSGETGFSDRDGHLSLALQAMDYRNESTMETQESVDLRWYKEMPLIFLLGII
jgi:hypothetical protein